MMYFKDYMTKSYKRQLATQSPLKRIGDEVGDTTVGDEVTFKAYISDSW